MTDTRRKFFTGAGALLGAAPAIPQQLSTELLDSQKFRAAVAAGELPSVERYLNRDPALVFARDERGRSVYLLAYLGGQAKVAEILVGRGLVLDIFEAAASGNVPRATELSAASPGIVHARCPQGLTPLWYAAAGGHLTMLSFLNTRGADLGGGTESPLLAAADHPDAAPAAEMVRFLAGNASNPNARRTDGKTPLHLAAARGHAEAAGVLIHRGAQVEARDAAGKTPLDVAAGETVKVLREASRIERVYFAGRYAGDWRGKPVARDDTAGLPQDLVNQFVAVAHNDFEKVREIYKKCPSILMTRATWDELAVEAAAHMGLVPMARFLAEEGSPVSTCTATLLGMTEMVKTMIRQDRERLRERGAHDIPLLLYTAFGDERVDIAGFLLDSGADVGTRGLGFTVLHVAAGKGQLALAELLLGRGVDVNAVAAVGGRRMTPLALALFRKQDKMAEFLKQRGGRA